MLQRRRQSRRHGCHRFVHVSHRQAIRRRLANAAAIRHSLKAHCSTTISTLRGSTISSTSRRQWCMITVRVRVPLLSAGSTTTDAVFVAEATVPLFPLYWVEPDLPTFPVSTWALASRASAAVRAGSPTGVSSSIFPPAILAPATIVPVPCSALLLRCWLRRYRLLSRWWYLRVLPIVDGVDRRLRPDRLYSRLCSLGMLLLLLLLHLLGCSRLALLARGGRCCAII